MTNEPAHAPTAYCQTRTAAIKAVGACTEKKTGPSIGLASKLRTYKTSINETLKRLQRLR